MRWRRRRSVDEPVGRVLHPPEDSWPRYHMELWEVRDGRAGPLVEFFSADKENRDRRVEMWRERITRMELGEHVIVVWDDERWDKQVVYGEPPEFPPYPWPTN